MKHTSSLIPHGGSRIAGGKKHSPGKGASIDNREEIGKQFEPYARFDKDLERFCCTKCGSQFETVRGIKAHLAECM